MTRFSFSWPLAAWLCALGLLGGPAQAQTPAATAEPSIGLPTYRSALADYQFYQGQGVRPWRQVNDEVGRIGGWRAYAREAAQAQPASAAGEQPAFETGPASASPPPSPPAADPHAGHHGGQP